MSNQSSCTQHDEQIHALSLSVAKVGITCWQLHFEFYLCLRVRFHKLSFWVPILAAEGPYFIKSWVPISLKVRSLFLSLEVPKSFRNSGYLQEINLIAAATTIKNSDLQKQEFQQLAKTKEIKNGDPVMHAFWALYSPQRSAACTPCIIPFSPFVFNTICVLRNGDPVVFINIYPPVQWCSLYKSNTDAKMLMWFMYIYALPWGTRWAVLQVINMDRRQSGRGRQYLPSEGRGNFIYCRPFLVARLSLPSHFLQNSNICMKS